MWIVILLTFSFSNVSSLSSASPIVEKGPTDAPMPSVPATPVVLARCDSSSDRNINGVVVICSGKETGENCSLSCQSSNLVVRPQNITIKCDADQRNHSRLSGELESLQCEIDENNIFTASCMNRCDNVDTSLFHQMMNSINPFPSGIPLVVDAGSLPTNMYDNPYNFPLYQPVSQPLPQELYLYGHSSHGYGQASLGLTAEASAPIFSRDRLPEVSIYPQSYSQFPQPQPFNEFPQPTNQNPFYPAMQYLRMQSPAVQEHSDEDPLLENLMSINKGQMSWPNVLDISNKVLRLIRTRYISHIGGCACDPECMVFKDCCSDYLNCFL